MNLFEKLWRRVVCGSSLQTQADQNHTQLVHKDGGTDPLVAVLQSGHLRMAPPRAHAPNQSSFSRLTEPSSILQSKTRTDADQTGFPRILKSRVTAVPIPPLETYYPAYSGLTPAQRAAYIFVRQEYLNGYAVHDVPLSYLFLCAYEIGARADGMERLANRFTALRSVYSHERKLNRYLAKWIVEARLASKSYLWDEIAESATADGTFGISSLDLQLLAGIRPEASSVIGLPQYHHLSQTRGAQITRAFDLVRSSYATDPLVDASRQGAKRDRQVYLFGGFPTDRSRLLSQTERRITVTTFTSEDSSLIRCIANLMDEAGALIGEPIDLGDHDIEFTRVAGTDHTVPIVRGSVTSSRLTRIDALQTLEDLERAIELFWTVEMCLLLSLVLWLAESKPYIEGLISFSRDLRRTYEGLSSALGTENGIAPFRRAFYALGQGTLAPWSLDVQATAPLDLRVGQAHARFTKPLQHQLRGSAARSRVFTFLTKKIANERSLPLTQVVTSFGDVTGEAQPQGF